MTMHERCRSCGSPDIDVFYEAPDVPSNSCILMDSREEAIGYPRGDIALAFCADCGFISNAAFDPALTEYSERYEETQGFSPTFNRFHHALAQSLIDRHRLHHKTVLEIGCGKGEFLALLCQLGDNVGIGFDPVFIPERLEGDVQDRMTIVRDFYSEKYADTRSDFIACKMTLEHIPDVFDFIRTVARTTAGRPDTMIFFQVPECESILKELRFWDIFYEHCSYFCADSLSDLFRRCGFEVVDVGVGYDDQYLMIEARPASDDATRSRTARDGGRALAQHVEFFQRNARGRIEYWQARIDELAGRSRRTVLWGSGSKAVSFLTTLGIAGQLEYVVDINPHRHGKFMPGTGHEIVGPEALRAYRPDNVIVMNPIYTAEITEMLAKMDLHPEIEAL